MNRLKKCFYPLLAVLMLGMTACSEDAPVEDSPVEDVVYRLTVSSGEGGSVSTDGGEYAAGDEVTVVATPDDGYEFSSWMEDGEVVSSSATYTFPMPERDVNLNAVFENQGNEQPDPSGINCLVVYYSWSGNSRSLATDIGNTLGCEVVEVELTTPYDATTDQELYPIAQDEIAAIDNDGVYPSITTSVDNLEEYDVVLVGYLLWYSRMATPMQAFLHNHSSQLAGKTIALFCSSASSGISQTVADARRLCPDADFTDPLWVRSANTADAHDDIVEWLTAINLLEN